jgi:hypothetical protein
VGSIPTRPTIRNFVKKNQIDKLFEEEYYSYNHRISDKVAEIEAIIIEIKDTTSKYSTLKNNISSMFVNRDLDDNNTLQVYELFSAIIRDINRLNQDLFNLIEKETK